MTVFIDGSIANTRSLRRSGAAISGSFAFFRLNASIALDLDGGFWGAELVRFALSSAILRVAEMPGCDISASVSLTYL